MDLVDIVLKTLKNKHN